MENIIKERFPVEMSDFSVAGEVSSKIKQLLKKLGVDSSIIRMIAVASYEAELNLVIHSLGGEIELEVTNSELIITCRDRGPGIADIDQAMQEGFSTAPDSVRDMGFGAGMGLPNIKRHSHEFSIESEVGVGTTIIAKYFLH